MRRFLLCLPLVFAVAIFARAQSEPATPAQPTTFSNPVFKAYLADPFCLLHDGTYYAVGTGKGETGDTHGYAKVVPMLRSKDLQNWEQLGPVLVPPTDEVGGHYWAPELAYNDGTFYLYYHANGNQHGFHIRVATSRTPEGPYKDTGVPLTDVARNNFAIDSTTFRDDDGQWYMFYATDFFDHDTTIFRGTALVVDKMKSMIELTGHPQTVMRAHWQWQVYQRDRLMGGVRADWYTLEGPSVIKHAGKYYCFYSGGNYHNDTYGVDYLVADHPTGPWQEAGRFRGPQIMRSVPGKVIGPGHNGLVKSLDGKQDYILYHAWNEAMTERQLWVDPLVWTDHGPQVERFVARIQECNRQAEEKQP